MSSQDGPDDDDVRQTYNFAPGYYGLVYRADSSSAGEGPAEQETTDHVQDAPNDGTQTKTAAQKPVIRPQYKLQAMKWGLIPFWTKRNPGYGSMMKTINCRDDSLAQAGGMWQHVKQTKRCIAIAQGFYEWLKKNGGKEKIPHYVKRKDGQLMCFAGLWDRVKFEDSYETLHTYTVITTDSNKQLSFLHDRMPVVLNNGSKEMFTWLDPARQEWSRELQSLLKPFDGELECYPVTREVGKVGNDSPSFIVPLDQNKQSISNFFNNQKAQSKSAVTTPTSSQNAGLDEDVRLKEPDDSRPTEDAADVESNAPKPITGQKRDLDVNTTDAVQTVDKLDSKRIKTRTTPSASPQKPKPLKNTPKSSPQKASSGAAKSAHGNMSITNFLNIK